MNQMSLLDVDTAPVSTTLPNVSWDMSLGDVKEVVNQALALNLLNNEMIQSIIDWLKSREMQALRPTNLPLEDRDIYFKGFNRAYKTYGICHFYPYYPEIAKIELTKHLKLKDNANGIINVLAHEVLHAILPLEETHGRIFKNAMTIVNEKLSVHIKVRGISGMVEKPKIKYELYCPCCGYVFRKYIKKTGIASRPSSRYCSRCERTLRVREV